MDDSTATVHSELFVNVKTINNEVYQFTVNNSTIVSDFKALIRSRTNISEDRQRLIYRGRVLTDSSTIGEYHIENGHTIQFVARPENYRELQQSAASQSSTGVSPPVSTAIQQTALDQMMRDIFGGEATGAVTAEVGARQSGLFSGSGSTPVALPSLDDGSMEHIRQGFLTLRTILATIDDSTATASVPSEGPASEPLRGGAGGGALLPHRPRFFPGQWLDVKDTVNQWLEATVMNVDHHSGAVFVHYNGWPSRWDEWIPASSSRLAPFRSRTAHSTALTSFVSPTPNVRISGAPSTGSDDVRSMLPEIRNMFRRLQPLIEEAADLAEQSYLSDHPSATPGLFVGQPQPAEDRHTNRQPTTNSNSSSSSSASGRSGDIWSDREVFSQPPAAPPAPRTQVRVPLSFSPTRQVAVNTSSSSSSTSESDSSSSNNTNDTADEASRMFNFTSTVLPQDLLSLLTPLLAIGAVGAANNNNNNNNTTTGATTGATTAAAVPRVVSQTTFVVGSDGNVRQVRQPVDQLPTNVPAADATDAGSGRSPSESLPPGYDNIVSSVWRNFTRAAPQSTVVEDEPPADAPITNNSSSSTTNSEEQEEQEEQQEEGQGSARLRLLCAELCPLLDRFGRVLSDTSPFLRSYSLPSGGENSSSSPPPPPASVAPVPPAAPPVVSSLEETLLQLMGVARPPSPLPIVAYRSPIRTLPHTPTGSSSSSSSSGSSSSGGGGSAASAAGPRGINNNSGVGGFGGPRMISVSPAGSLGGGSSGGNPRVEMHIAVVNRNGQIVTPVSVFPPGITLSQATAASNNNSNNNNNSDANRETSGAAGAPPLPASSAATASAGPVDLSSVQSLHNRATSLLQQVQDISARSQQLNERTSAVTEYSNALHSIIRNINTVEEIRTSQRRINEINAQIETIRNRALAISATAAGIRERSVQATASTEATTTANESTAAAAGAASNNDDNIDGNDSEGNNVEEFGDMPTLVDMEIYYEEEEDDDDEADESEEQEEQEEEGDSDSDNDSDSPPPLLPLPDQDNNRNYNNNNNNNNNNNSNNNSEEEADSEGEGEGLLDDLVPTVKIDTLLSCNSTGSGSGGSNSSSGGGGGASAVSHSTTAATDPDNTDRMNPSITERLQHYSGGGVRRSSEEESGNSSSGGSGGGDSDDDSDSDSDF